MRKKLVVGIIVAAIVAVVLLVVWLYDSSIRGPEYREKVSQCGTKDLIVTEIIATTEQKIYRKPGDPDYNIPAAGVHYLCTEQEAIDAGYVHRE